MSSPDGPERRVQTKPVRKLAVCARSRREAGRREQAQRDNKKRGAAPVGGPDPPGNPPGNRRAADSRPYMDDRTVPFLSVGAGLCPRPGTPREHRGGAEAAPYGQTPAGPPVGGPDPPGDPPGSKRAADSRPCTEMRVPLWPVGAIMNRPPALPARRGEPAGASPRPTRPGLFPSGGPQRAGAAAATFRPFAASPSPRRTCGCRRRASRLES